jgi:hypothetical protein
VVTQRLTYVCETEKLYSIQMKNFSTQVIDEINDYFKASQTFMQVLRFLQMINPTATVKRCLIFHNYKTDTHCC